MDLISVPAKILGAILILVVLLSAAFIFAMGALRSREAASDENTEQEIHVTPEDAGQQEEAEEDSSKTQ